MDSRRWERLAAATGIVFVVLQVATVLVSGDTPDFDDSTREIRQFLIDDGDKILAAAMLNAFSAFFFIWFLGSLRTYLRPAEADGGRLSAIAFGAGLVTIAMAVLGSTLLTGLAWDNAAVRADAGLLRVMWNLNFLVFVPIGATGAAFTLAVAVLVLRTRILPAWLAWLGVVASVLGLIGVIALVTDDPDSPIGFFGFAGYVLTMVFVLATSIVMVVRLGSDEPSQRVDRRMDTPYP